MEFKDLIGNNWYNRKEYLKNLKVPNIPNFPQYKGGAFVEEYENALVLNKMLEEFRNN